MNILAIDSTREQLLVVLIKNDNFIVHESEANKRGHSSSLLPCIDEMMEYYELTPNDLDAVAVVTGPGSFTGIRIGTATANAIAMGTGAKRIEINSFELLACGIEEKVFCTVPALHGNVFGAFFENGKLQSMDYFETNDIPNCQKVVKQEDYDEFAFSLDEISRKKFENGDFVEQLRPLYLRKSQAERAKDEI